MAYMLLQYKREKCVKVSIYWNSGRVQVINGISEYSDIAKYVKSGKVFGRVFNISKKNGIESYSLNFQYAEAVELESE
jgi:hypothetical protein